VLQQEYDQLKSRAITLTTRLEDARKTLHEKETLMNSKSLLYITG
jgi:hypothetical protein